MVTTEDIRKRIHNRSISITSALDIFKDVMDAARRAPNDQQDLEFMNFAVMFLDRLFGEHVTCCKDTPDNWQKIQYGGWLQELTNQCNALQQVEFPDVRNFGIVRFDPRVEKLFATLRETLELSSNMMSVLQQGRLFLAPIEFITTRAKWLSSNNLSDQYWYPFVQNSDYVHDGLVNWLARVDVSNVVDGCIKLPPMEYFIFCLVRYPFICLPQISKPGQDLFARPIRRTVSYNSRCKLPMTTYLVVLHKYIRDLFPYSTSNNLSNLAKPLLAMAVEYWIGNGLIVRRDHNRFEQKRMQILLGTSVRDQFIDRPHPMPTDVVFFRDEHRPVWTQMMLESTYLLLWHLLCDPQVDSIVAEANKLNSNWNMSSDGISVLDSVQLATPALKYLQQPLFDMLRIYFNGDKVENLMLVVDIWVLYCQPWLNFKHGKYQSSYKYYVAANLHFYTTLVTCFLRYIANLCSNWSTNDVDRPTIFAALVKVINVFATDALFRDVEALQTSAIKRYSFRNRINNIALGSDVCTVTVDVDPIALLSPRYSPRPSPDRQRQQSQHLLLNDSGPPTDVFINAVIRQHQLMFPDSRIDELPNHGMGSVREDNREQVDKIIPLLRELYSVADVGYLSYFTQAFADVAAELGVIPEPRSDPFPKEAIEIGISGLCRYTDSTSVVDLQVDHLDRPFASYEVHKLAYLLIRLSKLLNYIFGLPKVKRTATWDWQTIWNHSHGWWDDWQGQNRYLTDQSDENDINDVVKSQVTVMSWARFNLRMFASHTAVCILCVYLFFKYGGLIIVLLPLMWLAMRAVYLLFGPPWYEQFGFTGFKLFNFDEADKDVQNGIAALGEQERSEVLSGKRLLNRESIHYCGDPIDLPYFSYECIALVDRLVRWSKQLNAHYNLPRESQTTAWSTLRIIQYALKYRHKENPLLFCCRCFRFNLRGLAAVKTVGRCLLAIALGLLFYGWIGFTVAIPLGGIAAFLYYVCPDL